MHNPRYALAYGQASIVHCWRAANGWTDNIDADVAEAVRLARTAIEIDRDDPEAMCRAGCSLVFGATDTALGISMLDRSLGMNANSAQAWTLSGQARVYLGHCDIALQHLERALRLNPLDPLSYLMLMVMAFAHMSEGRFEEAIAVAQRSRTER